MSLAGVALVALLAPRNPLRAADPDDPFHPTYQANKPAPVAAPDDPFDPAYREGNPKGIKPPLPTKDQKNGKAAPPGTRATLSPATRKLLERITFTARLDPKKVQPGKTFRLTIVGKPKPGYWVYPITQRTAAQGASQLSKIQYEDNPYLKPLQPLTESKPELTTAVTGEEMLEHTKEFTWSQDVLVLPQAPQGVQTLRWTIRLTACNKDNCLTGTYKPLEVQIKVQGPSVPLTPEIEERLQQPLPEAQVVDTSSVWGFMALSMGAAVLMLLTPCVFPMIPITVSFFLKQSEKEHYPALLLAGVYSLTIILVLALAVFALGSVVVQLANNPWMNLGLGAVLIFFALSLLGMYEIELPSFLARFTSAREGRGGVTGAFFMALTFTITSFTCTGPFLGPLLAGAAVSQISTEKLILGALAYATVFAAPFFVLALFPRMLKTLPKSGGWLNVIKVVMGMLELAAALKFLGNTDLWLNPGDPMFFTYESVLCAWIALSVASGLYLLGLFRLPHDSPVEHIGVMRMLFASIFLGLAVYMTPALWRDTPQGVIGKGLVAFLPLDTKTDLNWTKDIQEAWDEGLQDDKLIFIDFTGVNCTNCRYNEKTVFTEQLVRGQLDKFVRLQLYTDTVPEKGLSPTEAEEQAKRNSKLQDGTFGDITNPFYAVIRPEKGKKPFTVEKNGRLRLNGTVLMTRAGLIPGNKIKEFVRQLQEAQK
jgi:thiol:disulfide interchange protein DsbD